MFLLESNLSPPPHISLQKTALILNNPVGSLLRGRLFVIRGRVSLCRPVVDNLP